MYWRQDAMLFPRPHEQPTLQTVAGLITTSVKTSDGETLPALYLEAKAGNPTILFFHGNGDQINTSSYLAELFAARGLGFAAVEYRGYPGATGTTSEDGIMADGLNAFDWVKSKCRCEIILMGHSLGTGVAVHVAAQREAQSVLLFAPYSSIADVAANRYWFFPVRALITNPIHSDERISQVTEPTVMIHGKEDLTTPIRFGQRLFMLANQPKQFLGLDAVSHNDVMSKENVQNLLELLRL